MKRKIGEKHISKRLIVGYDEIILSPVDTRECTFCLTMPQVEAILGLIPSLEWKTRWYSETDVDVDLDVIQAFAGDIARRLMMACCGDEMDGILIRLSDMGHYQESDDGGETWHDAPDHDPRNSFPQLPPILPPDTIDSKCTYADSVVEYMKTQFIEGLSSTTTFSDVVTLITAIIGAIFGVVTLTVGVLVVAIGAIASFILARGITACQEQFTEDFWDQFRCILYLHINDDGSFSQSALDSIFEAIYALDGELAVFILAQWMSALGTTGMTNTARFLLGAPDADCDCSASCADNWIILPLNGTIVSREGANVFVQTEFYAPEGVWLASIGYDTSNTDCCKLSGMAWENDTVVGISQILWLECGETRSVTPYHTSTAAPINHCINTVAAKMNGDTIVQYILTPCD